MSNPLDTNVLLRVFSVGFVSEWRMRVSPTMVLASLFLAACGTSPGGAEVGNDPATLRAAVQTDPMPNTGDAADDPAIWVHPIDPAKTLILGTDKKGGLHVYDVAGKNLQTISETARPNNVDVIYDFPLSGKKTDLALAGVRAATAPGLKLWRIDPDTLRLADMTSGDVIPVFGKTEPYGTCAYHSVNTGRYYCFVNNKDGAIEQYELKDDGRGRVAAEKVRAFKCSSIAEGCVADDERGWFYIAEEEVGIWKFPAEPDGGNQGVLIAKVGDHGLTSNVEGLTLYCAAGGKGYLIASSQGSNSFNVYDRQTGDFLLRIDPVGGAIGDVEETDGIAVSNRPSGPDFPQGLLVVQDGDNQPANQNFKLYRWEDIAGTRLLIDTGWSPRR
jgi:3-phytase